MAKENLTVSIVIPNFNGKVLLEKNLPMVLAAASYSENRIIEVIVVDDGSDDASVSLVKTRFPEVKLIKHKINRGFVAAVNTGVRMSKGSLVALINTDVIPRSDFLVAVLPHFKDKRVFAVSLHEDGYSWAKGFFEGGFILHEPGAETSSPHQTFWVSGGSGVFRRSYWIDLGGMDERLFSPFYWEDLDICYRAAKRGFINLWEPEARVIHHHESTVATLSQKYVKKISDRNQLLFVWKDLTSPNLFRKHLAGLAKRLMGHPGYLKIVLMALMKLPDVLKARGKEEREAKISDEAIFARFK